jgi:hypothetical protein
MANVAEKPRICWQVIGARVALILASIALVWTGATLIGLGDVAGPLSTQIGEGMACLAFVSLAVAAL